MCLPEEKFKNTQKGVVLIPSKSRRKYTKNVDKKPKIKKPLKNIWETSGFWCSNIYEICRPEWDISLFFYYLTVRDKDLFFFISIIFPKEIAIEFSDTLSEFSDTMKSETKYWKKQRELKENRRDKAKCLRGKINFNNESFTCYWRW